MDETSTHGVPPPGDFIREALKAKGWTQDDLARVVGRPLTRINEIIQGKQGITPETAVALGVALDTEAEVWLRREAEYRLHLQKVVAERLTFESVIAHPELHLRKKMFGYAPIRDMQKRGWIEASDSTETIEKELIRFFRVDSLESPPCIHGAMRKSSPTTPATISQTAWACRIRQVASTVPRGSIGEYDPSKIGACKKQLRKIAAYSAGASKVAEVLASFGIRFVVVEGLPGAKVEGFATWLDDKSPVIGVSLKYDRMDNFWHTLGHEVIHIEHNDVASIDGDADEREDLLLQVKPLMERRADSEGASIFVQPEELESFMRRVGPVYTTERINQFANTIKMHPCIIVGQIKHRGAIPWSKFSKVNVPIREPVIKSTLTDGWGKTLFPGVLK